MDNLRKKVKLLKALQGITYNEIAEYIEIKPNSFYSWLNNQFELGAEKTKKLEYVIDTLWEDQ